MKIPNQKPIKTINFLFITYRILIKTEHPASFLLINY